jgi:hypothetical protein
MDRRIELFKIEEYSILTDSSLPVANYFSITLVLLLCTLHSLYINTLYGCFCNGASVDSAFKRICYSHSMYVTVSVIKELSFIFLAINITFCMSVYIYIYIYIYI